MRILDRVGIVATGHVGYSSMSPGVSYKELMFQAASRAYARAGLDPRTQIDSFVCASEDLLEGTSIFDEYVPDQLGAVQRPVQTVAADGLFALATGVMLIRSGVAQVVACEAHSKASDIVTLPDILAFALDPVFERPLDLHPWFVAGLDMAAFLARSGRSVEECWEVAAANRRLALRVVEAAYGADITAEDVGASPLVSDPLRELDCAGEADGAVVVVLAAEERARALSSRPVWIDGTGWSTESPSLSSRTWGSAEYALRAARRAYDQAGIAAEDIDVAEVDDTFSYKQLQHADALGLLPAKGGRVAVNPSGGSLGRGNLFEANGLARVAEVFAQLRGEAADHQVEGSLRGVAQSWRGVPTSTGAVAVLTVAD